MNIELNQIFSNKQKLLFKIINIIDENYCDIQFEIDGLILYKQHKNNFKFGICLHPDKEKYKVIHNTKIFYQDCYEKILLCKTYIEFQKTYRKEYTLLFRNNWLDIAHKNLKRKNNFYSKNDCLNKALLCNTKNEFIKNYKNHYHTASRNGWLDEICKHMIKKYKYTKDDCLIKALKYNRRIDFQINDYSFYVFSLNHGWLDEICKHMKKLRHNWSVDDCYRLALKCNSRSEFSRKYPNAYDAALKRLKCLDEICLHMKTIDQYSFDRIIYAYLFPDNSIYIGLTKNFKQRKLHRNRNIKDTVTQYIIKTNLKPKIKFLTDYIPASEAQLKEQEFIDKYRKKGYNILNKVKAGSLGGSIIVKFK